MRHKWWILPAVLALALSGAAYASAETGEESPAAAKPNIVFVLTDDLSMNLIGHMSAVRTMRRSGTSFSRYFVADGLCCPSRASLLTGRYPHNTGVTTNKNTDPGGGYRAFVNNGNQQRTYGVALDDAGYRTGFFGKYLNGYDIRNHAVPPGWDEWTVSAGGYSNIGGSYAITNVHHKGDAKHITQPAKYLTDYIGGESVEFIDRARTQSQPFFLQLSTFAPHSRVEPSDTEPKFPPAMRDRPGHEFPNGDCGVRNGVRTNCLDLKVRRGTGFDEATYRTLDRDLRNRVRMVQSLNDQMIRIRSHLAGTGQLANTYFVFSSDNGFHLGEHGLLRGKGSPYDHDTRVPLIMTGPGVTAGAERTQIVQNVDLYATFQQMAGLTPRASDGRGLLGLARGETPTNWREAALYEHQGSEGPWNPQLDPDDADRDRATAAAGFVPGRHTYIGLRTDTWLYVEYAGGRRWLFDLRTDPGQNNNVHSSHPVVADRLSTTVRTYHRCGKGTAPSCWSAGQM